MLLRNNIGESAISKTITVLGSTGSVGQNTLDLVERNPQKFSIRALTGNKNIKLLTKTLNVYAEDKAYVDTINSIIDSNNFFQFDLLNQLFINS